MIERKNILLLGASLDNPNRGVAALASSLINIFHTLDNTAKITFLSGSLFSCTKAIHLENKTIEVNIVNYYLSPKRGFANCLPCLLLAAICYKFLPVKPLRSHLLSAFTILQSIIDAEFIWDIGGVDSFSDTYDFRRFFVGLLPLLIVIFLGKSFILLPQTYGPYKTKLSKLLAQYVFKKANYIFSRDPDIPGFFKTTIHKKLSANQISFCPDVAFTLEPKIPCTDEYAYCTKLINSNVNASVGINIYGLLYNGGYFGKNMFNFDLDYKTDVTQLCETLLKETNAKLFFVPHTFPPSNSINSDPDACRSISSKLENHAERIFVLEESYDEKEIKSIINHFDTFVGSRMHACIAALSQGIPTIGVACSDKFYGVFKTVGVSNLVGDARKLSPKEAIDRAIALYRNRISYKQILKHRHSNVKDLVYSSLKNQCYISICQFI